MQSHYDIINSSFLRDEAAVTCVDTVLSVSRHLFPKHLHPPPSLCSTDSFGSYMISENVH